MPRPKPFSFLTRLLNGVKTDIVEGDGVFAVMFDDDDQVLLADLHKRFLPKDTDGPLERAEALIAYRNELSRRFVPINCLQSPEHRPDSIKYARMIYVHKGHALKKAKELNVIFACNLFKVVEMVPLRIV